MGEFARGDVRTLGQTDIGERRHRRIVQGGLRRSPAEHAKARARARLHRQRDILERRKAGKDRAHLKRSRQAELRARMRGQGGDVAPGELDDPRIRSDEPGNLIDQRGLAGAVRPDDGMQLARHDVERQVVGDDERAERLAQPFQVQHRVRHERTSAPGRAQAR